MRKVVDDPRLIFKCCKLYYEEQIGQQQIADRLGISRVSVSRMLAAGKEMGIVLIQVISPDNLAYSQLEQKLEQLFRLKEAVVVEDSPLNTLTASADTPARSAPQRKQMKRATFRSVWSPTRRL